jgi:alpha-1,2-mannosyltransferase
MRQLMEETAARQPTQQTRSLSPWARRAGPAVLTAAAILYLVVYLHWPNFGVQIDAMVYRFGATRILDGLDLYSVGYTGNPRTLLFDYTPFAALLFIPLAFLNEFSVQILTLASAGVLLTFAVCRMVKRFGLTTATGKWSMTALLLGLLVWLEPIRLTVQLGQINLFLFAVVVADVLVVKERKWSGVGIGLAAGIKLTPAIFIVYLVLTGRLRAAMIATATLAGTVLLGFALLPSASRFFWLDRGFDEVKRISSDPLANTSLHGLFVRMHYPGALGTVAAIGLAVAGLAVAAIAWRRGHAVLGVAIVGMASAAASPFSWSHHWVWFAPLLVHLAYRGYVLRSRVSAWAMWLFWALFAGWFVSFGPNPETGLLSLRHGGAWDDIIPTSYLLAYLAVLLCTAAWLWRSSAIAEPLQLEERVHTDEFAM